jgi:5-methylcytosine-specific restriction protein B
MLHRDQTVGHAYFTKISTYQGLCRCLTQQVIPLLQEYFYEDWERIQLVFRDLDISGGPMEDQFIKTEELAELEILGMDHEEYEDSIKYSVVNDTEITPSMIKRVYS